jgi:hypothetical protein
MKHEDLPERWDGRLQSYLHEQGVKRNRLSAEEFHHHLKLTFEDGSFAFFHHAFYLLDENLKEVAIFTKHCGYHIFPLFGTRLELLESKWTDVGTNVV